MMEDWNIVLRQSNYPIILLFLILLIAGSLVFALFHTTHYSNIPVGAEPHYVLAFIALATTCSYCLQYSGLSS